MTRLTVENHAGVELEGQIAAMGDPILEARIMGECLAAAARVLAREAKKTVPYSDEVKKEGEKHLRDTIRVRRRWWKIPAVSPTGKVRLVRVQKAAAEVIAGARGARHAHLVELGTVKMAANPFMARAAASSKGKQQRAMITRGQAILAKLIREYLSAGKLSKYSRRLSGI